MILSELKGPKDFHVHTKYCDGGNSPEEMVIAAIDKGMQTLGFSGHCYTFFDESYCMLPETCNIYEDEVRALGKKYEDKIKILCGIEQDYWSEADTSRWDYVIGSVHYIRVKGDLETLPEGLLRSGEYVYIPVDETAEIQRAGVDAFFDGDVYAFIEAYFQTVGDVVSRTGADIIGHFDLVCKFNDGTLFDESHPRFVAAYRKAVDELVEAGVPFEINTSPLLKGYRDEVYPSQQIREYIETRGGKFILSSDSHAVSTLCYGFEKFQ